MSEFLQQRKKMILYFGLISIFWLFSIAIHGYSRIVSYLSHLFNATDLACGNKFFFWHDIVPKSLSILCVLIGIYLIAKFIIEISLFCLKIKKINSCFLVWVMWGIFSCSLPSFFSLPAGDFGIFCMTETGIVSGYILPNHKLGILDYLMD
jgi:hypothetical protein